MSGIIPDPPVHADRPDTLRLSGLEVVRASAQGRYGLCVMCHRGGYRWLDLTACGLDPVIGRTGTATDQVPLHDGCVRALVTYWVQTVRGLAEGEAPEAVQDGDETSGQAPRADRRALLGGMYA